MYRTLAGIMIGNQFYDKFAGNSGQMFGVQDAATKMQQARALGITMAMNRMCSSLQLLAALLKRGSRVKGKGQEQGSRVRVTGEGHHKSTKT